MLTLRGKFKGFWKENPGLESVANPICRMRRLRLWPAGRRRCLWRQAAAAGGAGGSPQRRRQPAAAEARAAVTAATAATGGSSGQPDSESASHTASQAADSEPGSQSGVWHRGLAETGRKEEGGRRRTALTLNANNHNLKGLENKQYKQKRNK